MTLNKQLLLPSFVWLVFSVSLLLLAILKSSVVCSQDTVLNVYSIVSSVVAPSGTVTCNEGQALAGCGYESSCCNQYTYNWAVVPFVPQNSTGSCYCQNPFSSSCSAICVSDKLFGAQSIISATGNTQVSVTCPSGLNATGCGIELDSTTSDYPAFFPESPTTCTCSANSLLTCYALCSAINVQIVSIQGIGHIVAKCPAGLMVMGCGIQTSSSGFERFPAAYPILNGCQCYENFGLTCFATCSALSYM